MGDYQSPRPPGTWALTGKRVAEGGDPYGRAAGIHRGGRRPRRPVSAGTRALSINPVGVLCVRPSSRSPDKQQGSTRIRKRFLNPAAGFFTFPVKCPKIAHIMENMERMI